MPPTPTTTLERAAPALSRGVLLGLSDAELLTRHKRAIAAVRAANVELALYTSELDRRSSRELGHSGLLQGFGVRSTQQYLERVAGVAPDEARAIVHLGELLSSGDDASTTGPAAVLAESVADGALSILAADAIVTALGDSSEKISTEALTDAASLMVTLAPELTIRRVTAEARALRDALDTAGVAEREARLREQRYLSVTLQPDGMTRVSGLLDPESAAIVTSAFDQITAPRRGGPRFVDPEAAARSQAVVDDPRTNGQLLLDAFVEMVRIAGAADTGRVFAQRRPAVVIRVDKSDMDAGAGIATIDGQTAAVSIATAERFVCSAGAVPVVMQGGAGIDAAKHVRFHTTRQRQVIAERDRGCLWPGCEHPPSWSEVHHPHPYSEGGETTVANGILLCRFHHRNVHNNGWRVVWRDDGWVAVPPRGSGRVELPLRPKRSNARAA
ncbi:HNH endonuclease signature motif containing protein [soil metagenome]